jgi:hypothetical protein
VRAYTANDFFFVLGNPRSGTTLLRLMLNNHPLITIPPESGFMLWLANSYANEDFHNTDIVDRLLRDIGQARKFETWNLDMVQLHEFIIQNSPSTYQEAALLVYRFYAHSVNKEPKLLGDKNNFYIEYLLSIKELFPNAKLIFIVRDGRDVACSYKELAAKKIDSIYAPKLPFEIEKIAREWSSNNLMLIHKMSDVSALVKYEELISKPEKELMRLCDFLRLSYEPQMLEYHTRNAIEQQEPLEFLQWKEKTLKAPDASNAGKYKHLLTPQEIERFNRIAGDVLTHFDYEI